MNYLHFLFYFFMSSQLLFADSYVHSLDLIIDKKVAIVAPKYRDIKNIVYKINSSIKKQVALREIEDFLESKHSILFFFCEKFQSKIEAISGQQSTIIYQALKDLEFALGAKLYLHYLECCKQKMFYNAVKNYDALIYWQNEKFYENRPFYQKYIGRWFSSLQYQKMITKNIALLEKISQQTNGFLGFVKYSQQLLEQALTQEEFEANLKQVVALQYKFLDMHDKNLKHSDIQVLLKNSFHQVRQLSLEMSDQYAQCQLPSHLQRHWKMYTALAMVMCASTFVYNNYKDDIVQGSHYFFHEHMQGPLQRITNTLTGFIQLKPLEAPKFSIEENQRTLQDSIESERYKLEQVYGDETSVEDAFMKNVGPSLDRSLDRFFERVEERYNVVKNARQGGQYVKYYFDGLSNWFYSKPSSSSSDTLDSIDYSTVPYDELERLVADKDRRVLANPEKNFVSLGGSYIRKLEREVIDGKNQANQVSAAMTNQLNQVLHDVHVLLGITALIPMVTVVGGSLFASQKIYNSVVYQPIRIFTRHIDVLLNTYLHDVSSFEVEGALYFLTEQLRLHVSVLTVEEQKLMDTDITALQSSALDYKQKFNVVQRMYRTYPCLSAQIG